MFNVPFTQVTHHSNNYDVNIIKIVWKLWFEQVEK